MSRTFDAFLIIDWSAAVRPKTGADSIWLHALGAGTPASINLPTRAEAMARLESRLERLAGRGQRILVGFDFAFGYPAGFAHALGLKGEPWRATWQLLAREIEDDARNQNNRFAVAADLNRRVTGGRGPFWGCPPAAASPFLGPRQVDADGAGLEALRECDRRSPVRAQSPFKLYTTGAVGSQSLTGIARLARLRFQSKIGKQCRVWPFETGWQAPADAPVVFVEAFPSLLPVSPRNGEVRDEAQVRTLAYWLRAQDRAGELTALFRGPGAAHKTAQREEGWILGVS